MELDNTPLPSLPRRADGSHKGTFGTVAVVGGTCALGRVMVGAPALAALGALRSGAGLVTLVMPRPILPEAIGMAPSATGVAFQVDGQGDLVPELWAPVFDDVVDNASAMVVGPGMGDGAEVADVALRAVQQEHLPVVVDADALNALAGIRDLFRDFRAPAVLTPHPGEFRRLAEAMRITADPTLPATRPTAAAELAQRLGCIVVLKGAGTVVSDGQRAWVCERGHPCMATAGTGDVLAGVIAGLAAQHSTPPLAGPQRPGRLTLYDAARAAVQAHALAGERWASRRAATGGMLAGELADLLPEVIEGLRA